MKRTALLAAFLLLTVAHFTLASSGKAGAAFLDIPVGAGPAALGGAYTALAQDSYAATYNPAGLASVLSTQFSGQHLAYLNTLHYEYLSFAVPLGEKGACATLKSCGTSALGGSVQYLGSGNVNGMDDTGASIGTFSSYYAAYNLAYGHSLGPKAALGVTGKMIHAKIADVSASAYAADLGATYDASRDVVVAVTLTHLGTPLKFLEQEDPLPAAAHVAVAYRPNSQWTLTGEGVYAREDSPSAHVGAQWRPVRQFSLRTGYRTDTLRELSPVAGLSAGMGLTMWGQELSYAYVPYGKLGDTHYVSLVVRLGEAEHEKQNLIRSQAIKVPARWKSEPKQDAEPEYQQLMELLNDDDQHLAKQRQAVDPSVELR